MDNNAGYIYIFSNPVFKYDDLFKIGVTKDLPNERCVQLSRSTAIPDTFKLEYFKKVNDSTIAEKRIHLLLKEYRYRNNKEFFQIKIKLAKAAINKVVDHLENYSTISDAIGIYKDFDMLELINTFSAYARVNNIKLMQILLASVRGNTMLDQILNLPEDIADGFLSAKQVADLLKFSPQHAAGIMGKFAKQYRYSKIKSQQKVDIQIFEDIRFGNRELIWTFTRDFRKLFINHCG